MSPAFDAEFGPATGRAAWSMPWLRDDAARVVLVSVGSGASPSSIAARLSDGHDVIAITVGRQLVDDVVRLHPDVVIVEHHSFDSGLVRVCRDLSAAVDCRILVVAAEDAGEMDDAHVIDVLDAGADDYLGPSMTMAVLLARVRVALRSQPRQHDSGRLAVGDIIIDLDAHVVHISGVAVEMPPVRFELLVALARQPHSIVTQETLLAGVWGQRSGIPDARRLRSAISLLRGALGVGDQRPSIENVPHVGYRLVVRSGDAAARPGQAVKVA